MDDQEFVCPYAKVKLKRSCEVESCNFCLEDNPISHSYKRCFLNYLESLKKNKFNAKKDRGEDYLKLPLKQRCQIVGSLYGISEHRVRKIVANFYKSMFSVMAQDSILAQRRLKLDPIPYKQCAVCGIDCEDLFLPQSSTLPNGFGYCGYKCYQLKPPPLLNLELMLGLDSEDLLRSIEYENASSRPKFVRQVMQWVLGSSGMK